MAFRRYKRSFSSLSQVYREILDLTTRQIVKAAAQSWAQHIKDLQPGSQGNAHRNDENSNGEDVNGGEVDEFGAMDKPSSNERILTPKGRHYDGKQAASVTSSFGVEVKYPSADASPEELGDFYRYLLSGRGKFIFQLL
jgi:hypothetical protein